MSICWNQQSVKSLVNLHQLLDTSVQYTLKMILPLKHSYVYVDKSNKRQILKVVRKKVISRQAERRHCHQDAI